MSLKTKIRIYKTLNELKLKFPLYSGIILIIGYQKYQREVIANYLHFLSKCNGSFVAIDCKNSEKFIESELYKTIKLLYLPEIEKKTVFYNLYNGTLFLDNFEYIGDESKRLLLEFKMMSENYASIRFNLILGISRKSEKRKSLLRRFCVHEIDLKAISNFDAITQKFSTLLEKPRIMRIIKI
jgi:hypothetical protein